MSEPKCPLCNEVIKAGQVRKEWWMSDTDKRIAHVGCITAYEKGVVKGKSVVNESTGERGDFMHYEEKMIDGVLHWRNTHGGP